MEWMGRTYTITEAEKRKVLGENLAEAHGFDLTDIERQQSNDEYADRDGVADPYPHDEFRGGRRVTDEARVESALHEVIDPCSAANGSNLDIVEMGLIDSIAVSDGRVAVDMRLTTPACDMVAYFDEEIRESVGSLSGVNTVKSAPTTGSSGRAI